MPEQKIKSIGRRGWILIAGWRAAEAMSASGTKLTLSSQASTKLFTAACPPLVSVRWGDWWPQVEIGRVHALAWRLPCSLIRTSWAIHSGRSALLDAIVTP